MSCHRHMHLAGVTPGQPPGGGVCFARPANVAGEGSSRPIDPAKPLWPNVFARLRVGVTGLDFVPTWKENAGPQRNPRFPVDE